MAKVVGLLPGTLYDYKVYQQVQDSSDDKKGINRLKVNGGPEITTDTQQSEVASAAGTAIADLEGEISFEFVKVCASYASPEA